MAPVLLSPRVAPAVAADEPVSVLIESVSPAAPTRRDDVTVTGRIANVSDVDVALPQVQLRVSSAQLSSRDEVTAVMDGSLAPTDIALPTTLTPLGETLSPGQQAQFTLRVPVAELGLDDSLAGVYALAVEALSGELPVVQAGTVIPWFPPAAQVRPTRMAWLWPIAQRPAIAADDLVVDPALPGEFTSTGRLGRLLAVGREHPVSWLVDTATWQTAHDLADGYRVGPPDNPQPGDLTEPARQFADDLGRVLAGPAVVTQYALADADALQRDGLTQFVVRAASLPGIIGEQAAPAGTARSDLFLAPGGASDQRTLQTLVDAGVRDLLLSDRSFPPDPELPYTPSGVTTVPVGGTEATGLLSDQILARVLQQPLDTAAERSRAKQEFLAQTALITLELPAQPRRVIAAPPSLWDPPRTWLRQLMRATDDASWLRLVDVATVAAAPQVPRLDLGYGEAERRRELPLEYTQRISDLSDEVDRLAAIVVDRTGYGETFQLALQRAASALWRPDDSGRTEFLDTLDAQIQDEHRKVRVVSTGTVTLAGESGVIPLTIANDLDRPVSVGVQLAAVNPITLQSTSLDAVRIDAQEKAGVEVPVRVVGSQPMTVTVILTDDAGQVYDDSAQLELRSTASSRIATIVAVVGGVALVVLVSLNLLRRRQRSRTDEPAQPDESHV